MSDVQQFLDEMMPRIHVAETALHNGDAGPRFEMWSHTDPVTVYGAAFSPIGWAEVAPMFETIASNFTNCRSCEWEVVAADVGQDFAYLLAIERTTASVGGSEPTPYTLRSTTIFRRENDEWKIVHRHADPSTTPQSCSRVCTATNNGHGTDWKRLLADAGLRDGRLHDGGSLRWSIRLAHHPVDVDVVAVDRLHIHPAPHDAAVLDAHYRDAAHRERRAVYMCPGPTPLTDLDSTGVGGHDQLGAEVGHPREHAPPVLPDLVATVEDSAGMRRLLTAVPRREACDKRIEVVRVHRRQQPIHHLARDRPPRRRRDPLPVC